MRAVDSYVYILVAPAFIFPALVGWRVVTFILL
jgi:hypothetical protein